MATHGAARVPGLPRSEFVVPWLSAPANPSLPPALQPAPPATCAVQAGVAFFFQPAVPANPAAGAARVLCQSCPAAWTQDAIRTAGCAVDSGTDPTRTLGDHESTAGLFACAAASVLALPPNVTGSIEQIPYTSILISSLVSNCTRSRTKYAYSVTRPDPSVCTPAAVINGTQTFVLGAALYTDSTCSTAAANVFPQLASDPAGLLQPTCDASSRIESWWILSNPTSGGGGSGGVALSQTWLILISFSALGVLLVLGLLAFEYVRWRANADARQAAAIAARHDYEDAQQRAAAGEDPKAYAGSVRDSVSSRSTVVVQLDSDGDDGQSASGYTPNSVESPRPSAPRRHNTMPHSPSASAAAQPSAELTRRMTESMSRAQASRFVSPLALFAPQIAATQQPPTPPPPPARRTSRSSRDFDGSESTRSSNDRVSFVDGVPTDVLSSGLARVADPAAASFVDWGEVLSAPGGDASGASAAPASRGLREDPANGIELMVVSTQPHPRANQKQQQPPQQQPATLGSARSHDDPVVEALFEPVDPPARAAV
ncbi:hypothetical protein HK105_209175 [Polyrhizophydium stewartii]|uniref:Uncharacterized protein n=1 Tax=Polyrhizophydium stewartii TaxID=2732419 RepID=A0ABR4MVT2_9FUNG